TRPKGQIRIASRASPPFTHSRRIGTLGPASPHQRKSTHAHSGLSRGPAPRVLTSSPGSTPGSASQVLSSTQRLSPHGVVTEGWSPHLFSKEERKLKPDRTSGFFEPLARGRYKRPRTRGSYKPPVQIRHTPHLRAPARYN